MRAARQRFGALALAALLLLPLAFSGHLHGGESGAARACGACIAVRHTPSLGPVAAVACAPHVVELALRPVVAVARSAAPRPAHLGRGPPLPVPVAFV